MDSRLVFELKTTLAVLQASIAAYDEIERETGSLTRYGHGTRDAKKEIMERLEKILEVNT